MYSFTASRLSANHNLLFPDSLEIDDTCIRYHKGALLGGKTITIDRNKIASVRIERGIIFHDLVIESLGGSQIIVEGFTEKKLSEIEALLEV